VPIQSVKISANGRKVSIELAELKEKFIYDLKIGDLQTSEGKKLMNHAIFYTANRLK
jgi:hypothetical protein